MSEEHGTPFVLIGGPPDLLESPPDLVRRDGDRLILPWRAGYEHYELDETTSRERRTRAYRWAYRTDIAE
ncbi:DUF5988 family protein [Embleya sp. NPDC059237]|uniref:DUF5988 family protein n=1 Tax=Embleya sp. NPDC059237 TaxID=3346784 RepID=UPI0036A95015